MVITSLNTALEQLVPSHPHDAATNLGKLEPEMLWKERKQCRGPLALLLCHLKWEDWE